MLHSMVLQADVLYPPELPSWKQPDEKSKGRASLWVTQKTHHSPTLQKNSAKLFVTRRPYIYRPL